jgi:hypothetical protein
LETSPTPGRDELRLRRCRPSNAATLAGQTGVSDGHDSPDQLDSTYQLTSDQQDAASVTFGYGDARRRPTRGRRQRELRRGQRSDRLGALSPACDAAGKMTSDGTYDYSWNARGELVSIKQGTTVVATYAYDASTAGAGGHSR